MQNHHEVLTLAETAKFLRLSPKSIREKVEAGEIPGQRIGRAWRFSRVVLEVNYFNILNSWKTGVSKNHAVMTLVEASKFLRLSPNFIEEKAEAGEIPAQRIGRSWRFSKAALEGWLRGRSSAVALLKMVEAFKDDDTFVPMLDKAYRERKRLGKNQ